MHFRIVLLSGLFLVLCFASPTIQDQAASNGTIGDSSSNNANDSSVTKTATSTTTTLTSSTIASTATTPQPPTPQPQTAQPTTNAATQPPTTQPSTTQPLTTQPPTPQPPTAKSTTTTTTTTTTQPPPTTSTTTTTTTSATQPPTTTTISTKPTTIQPTTNVKTPQPQTPQPPTTTAPTAETPTSTTNATTPTSNAATQPQTSQPPTTTQPTTTQPTTTQPTTTPTVTTTSTTPTSTSTTSTTTTSTILTTDESNTTLNTTTNATTPTTNATTTATTIQTTTTTTTAETTTPKTACSPNPCKNEGNCTDKANGTFECRCPPNFSGTTCKTQSPCSSNPCHNGGSCTDNNNTSFTCSCTSGWVGSTCNTTNLCASTPCLHNGTCYMYQNNTDFGCFCPPKWGGKNCGTDIDDRCKNGTNPCQNNATCIDTVDEPICNCTSGFLGTHCEHTNFCVSNPCLNGGNCSNNANNTNFTCTCTAGLWGGDTCQTDIDNRCKPEVNPCQHNGTCIDHVEDPTCNCTAGWMGDHCQIKDFCAPSPCLNGGSCSNNAANSNFTCACTPGVWGGDTCDEDIEDNCKDVICQNGGTCKDKPNNFTCECPVGIGGTYCTEDTFDSCSTNPCKHGATCTDKLFGQNCSCTKERMGDTCETYNYCHNNPCKNGGDCMNNEDNSNFTCTCIEKKWGGDTCEIDIENNCALAGEPCMFGSTCRDGVGNYTCVCLPGTEGRNCSIDLPNCKPDNPCQNGGLCSDLVNGHACFCPDGWTGKNCTEDVDECKEEKHSCMKDAQICSNKHGSYECLCNQAGNYKNVSGVCTLQLLWNIDLTVPVQKPTETLVETLQVPINFPYFGKNFSEIKIYRDGYITLGPNSFSQSSPPLPSRWPLDPPILAFYWTPLTFDAADNDAGVSVYQAYSYSNSSNKDLFNEIKNHLVNATTSFQSFDPLWAVVVTFYGARPRGPLARPGDDATFQLILTTDGQASYAFINYQSVWANTEFGGRPSVFRGHSGKAGVLVQEPGPLVPERKVMQLFEKDSITSLSGQTKTCLDALQGVTTGLPVLKDCPCNMAQAEADFLYKPDAGSSNCYTTRFWSRGGNPVKQRCCYDGTYGYLLVNQKLAGLPVFKDDNRTLVNARDVCCSDDETCKLFYSQHPSPDCSRYNAPTTAAGFGDPNMMTFDENKFAFNGYGDFLVANITSGDGSTLELQARTTAEGSQNHTYFIAYWLKVNGKKVAHVTIDGTDLKAQAAGGSAVASDDVDVADPNNNTVQVYQTAIAQISISIQDDKHLMHKIDVPGSPTITGLMGNKDKDPTNDFVFGDGTALPGEAGDLTGEQVNAFGESWRVTEQNSLFNYTAPHLNYTTANKPDFPSPVLPTSPQKVLNAMGANQTQEAKTLCEGELFCLQNFLMGRMDQAAKAKNQAEKINQENADLHLVFESPASTVMFGQGDLPLQVKGQSNGVTFEVIKDTSPSIGSIVNTSIFKWDLETNKQNLRAMQGSQSLRIGAKMDNGATGFYEPEVVLCLCDSESQCTNNSTSQLQGKVTISKCDCGASHKGLFCTERRNLCVDCFNQTACDTNKTSDYCAPCPSGYEGDGFTCKDKNECLDNSTCPSHSTCDNFNGGFDCECFDGYNKTGNLCVDINECEANTSVCGGANEYCHNFPGGHECLCEPGYVNDTTGACKKAQYIFPGSIRFKSVGDQTWSEELRDPSSAEFKALAAKVEAGILSTESARSKISVVKVTRFEPDTVPVKRRRRDVSPAQIIAYFVAYLDTRDVREVEDAITACISKCSSLDDPVGCPCGGLLRVLALSASDENLCSISPPVNYCNAQSTECITSDDNIRCKCRDGFTPNPLDISSCQDIDECTTVPKDCEDCENSYGSYSCRCPKLQVWSHANESCTDSYCAINSPCQNGGTCQDLPDDGYACLCTAAYKGPTCTEDDYDYTRVRDTVIIVSSVLGALCLVLLSLLLVMCFRRKKGLWSWRKSSVWSVSGASYLRPSMSESGLHIPRPKIDVLDDSHPMVERPYVMPGQSSGASNGDVGPGATFPQVYSNHAFDPEEGTEKM